MAGRSWQMAAVVAATVAVTVLAVIGVTMAIGSGGETGRSAAGNAAGDAAGGGRVGSPGTSDGGSARAGGGDSPGTSSHARPGVAPRVQQPRPDIPLTVPIQSYEVLAPDRLQVRYTSGVPECYGRLDRALVDESADRVVVTLRLAPVKVPSDAVCPDIALVKDTEVRLDGALGDRQVLDGSGMRPVPRGHHGPA
jgi:hypothetical protein